MQLARSLSRRPKLESRSDNVGPHFPSHDLTDPNGKHRRQNFISTDSARPLSSTRAFSHPLCVAVCAQGWPCRRWAAAYTLGSECTPRCGQRRAAAGRLQRPPKFAVLPILLESRVFPSRGSSCVCRVGSFRRRALPYTPRSVCGPRGAARHGRPPRAAAKTRIFTPHAQSSGVAWRGRT